MSHLRRWLTALAVAMAFAAAAPVVSASASPTLSCGAVLAHDTTLTADLTGCPSDGLAVAADNITVNLHGHVLTARATSNPAGITTVGVRVNRHRHVTIINGTIAGFDQGVSFVGSPDGAVTAVTITDSTDRGMVFGNGSDRAVVTRNVVTGSARGGIVFESSSDAEVSANTLKGNHVGVAAADGAERNQIHDNRFTDNPEASVEIAFADWNVVSRNVMLRSNGGVNLEAADHTTISDNQIRQMAGPDGIGLSLYGSYTLAARNIIADAVRYGIEVDDFQDPGHSPITGNIVRDNRVSGGTEGISIGPEAGGVVLETRVEGNDVRHAADDGIRVLGPSTGLQTTVVMSNVVVSNGNLGIEAVPGVVDGGGNRAARNGNPLQCLNVGCPIASPPRHYFLAIGDSIAYGFQTQKALAGLPPTAFNTGFVDYVSTTLRRLMPAVTTINYSCPGESTISIRTPCVWKASGHGLHNDYDGPQLTASIKFLRAHRGQVSPITVSLNGNDIDAFLATCPPGDTACVQQGAPVAIAQYGQRLAAIVAELRAAAPEAEIILTGAYDPTIGAFPFADPLYVALNSAQAQVANASRAFFADPFPVFNPQGNIDLETATICALTLVCSNQDSHPSDLGYQALGRIVWITSAYDPASP